ncbi:MAG: energy-coupling factor ABC transporter ATP-binding protein [Pirellulaceae bacterium]|nr:energy-coupling factor ABC transporter ATP-binding protein [Pirellulaceae bacterium]
MNESLVSLDDVSYGYDPNRPVLNRCNFRLDRGERVGLVGANGSGKTTLLKLIVGLLRPADGRIEIFGQTRQCERDFHEVRRRVGFLFQDSDDQLFCPTVAEDVAFGPLNLGKTRDEAWHIVAATLDALGLNGFEQRITYKLSGGEKRMVALASVLSMHPEVLLLDEPTAGLDDAAADRVLEVLSELPQAMILATHDPRLLDRLATRRLQLNEGRFLAETTRI